MPSLGSWPCSAVGFCDDASVNPRVNVASGSRLQSVTTPRLSSLPAGLCTQPRSLIDARQSSVRSLCLLYGKEFRARGLVCTFANACYAESLLPSAELRGKAICGLTDVHHALCYGNDVFFFFFLQDAVFRQISPSLVQINIQRYVRLVRGIVKDCHSLLISDLGMNVIVRLPRGR